MSLVCLECDRMIDYGTPLHAVTLQADDRYSALCESCLNKIPQYERIGRANAKYDEEAMLLICVADSTENVNGTYALFAFAFGTVLFGVDPVAAKRLLPKVADYYCGDCADEPVFVENNHVDENRQS